MTPYYSDPWLTVWQGDCREVMTAMEPESVHCVVTSPPYWGLRDYGTATWLGGDEGCDHLGEPKRTQAGFNERYFGKQPSEDKQSETRVPFGRECGKCGAVRQDSQLGLEPTPEEYVANMVAVFREVRRVLRADGTVWLNLGDSYNNRSVARRSSHQGGLGFESDDLSKSWADLTQEGRTRLSLNGGAYSLKEKDLVGIPWRVAFALQADGWYLRSDIIWSKPNPMPESVTDRPTKAHEYLFLLSKQPRYFYDADAVREAAEYGRSDWRGDQWASSKGERGGYSVTPGSGGNRNLRSVWSIATQPYPGAHFATFPEALVEPCVKAGTSERGVCPECGAPWVRETNVEYRSSTYGDSIRPDVPESNDQKGRSGEFQTKGFAERKRRVTETTGWRRSCTHDAVPVPATVLDPFAGSGTTGRVAQRLGRRAVLIDLSGEYLTQAMRRNQDIPLGLESA